MKDLSGISFFLSTQMQSFECHYVLEGRIFGHGRKKGTVTTLSSRLIDCRKTCVSKGKVINQDEPGASEEDHWKLVWKLDVPPKVKVFWWRVLHDYLPARKELHRRHIEPTAHCETCGAVEESARHVLFECTMARIFWKVTKKLTGVKIPWLHPESWAIDLLHDNICPR